MCLQAKYKPAGDKAVVIELENVVSKEINQRIRALMIAIEEKEIDGVLEVVPTYSSLMVHYEVQKISYDQLIKKLKVLEEQLEDLELSEPKTIKIPTVYGGEYGPDIEKVAEYNGLTVDEVVEIHTSKPYLIYMLGFVPGFPYLGGMDEQIATPRLENPRTKIPAGSVGIAGKQTGIYPIDTPGGWQLIGRTHIKLYEPYSDDPFLLKAGNYVKFVQISEEEYKSKNKNVERGKQKWEK
ncbi:5-oxoprolinase subunit PxpB [Acetohalobium arabaticum]|uniref:Allophanate hydrolase subunit 1 n=1 Tax=Acetohalobium arabaticum (strain ATCC 49924 / DSM 5501 / Z-7288) TaxID=574087 RepID=D9QUX8_ACEAZ|nr:5-oxoprolinase subunit PxpB [Acetohalobium arabaticum]ADL12037.1 Allophanate hydrolase subunit 1 [Acetohalobium arabaticum DSM 5501]